MYRERERPSGGWLRTSNPTMREDLFVNHAATGSPMTLAGTLAKTGILFVLLFAFAAASAVLITRSPGLALPVIYGGGIAGCIIALIVTFKPNSAPFLAPAYAVLMGLFVGGVSLLYTLQMRGTSYAGIVPLAILGTLLVFGIMLVLYASRIIKVTQTFVAVVVGATLAIMVLYLGTFLLGFVWEGARALPIFTAGPIGIIFSVIVIGIAALNLALDFHIIESGVQAGAPKYMEWFAGFGLMVTLVWIYVEMLRLIAKIAGSRN